MALPNTAPRRILYIITTLDVGGAEKHLLWLAQGMIERGARCDVLYLKGEGRLVPRFKELGCEVAKVEFERPTQAFSAVLALASRMKRGDYDVVHSHLLKADALTALAARLFRPKRLIASKHNEEQVLKKRPVAIVHRVLTRVVDRVIALSDYVARYVATTGRIDESKITRVYYGIDPKRFANGDRVRARAALGLSDAVHVGLCVARFHPQKDHATLFRAVDRLRKANRNVVLLLAGGDPFYGFKEQLEKLCESMGLTQHVRFLGIRDDVPELLAACDVFVLPSIYEGLGLVYLEAMAASRPVLATNGTAIPEVVVSGETGELITIGDDAALATAWEKLVLDRSLGERYGKAGSQRVDRMFTLPRMIDETLAVYRG